MFNKIVFPERASAKSNDLWDYLPNIIDTDCPSRKDRDILVKLAEHYPDFRSRLNLWDFFFRVNEDKVGAKQKDLINQWKKCQYEDIPNAQQEAINDAHQRALDREKQAFDFINETRKKDWLILIISGALCLLLGVIALLYPNNYFRTSLANSLIFSLLLLSSSLLISVLALSRVFESLKDVWGIFRNSIKWIILLIISGIFVYIILENGFSFTIPIQFIAIIIAFFAFIVFFTTAFKTTESKIVLLKLTEQINKDKIAEYSRIAHEGRIHLDTCKREIFFLESQIRALKSQIPQIVTPDRVYWLFRTSIEELRKKSIDLCGFGKKIPQNAQPRQFIKIDNNIIEPLLILAPIKFSPNEIDKEAVKSITAYSDDYRKIFWPQIDNRPKTELYEDGEKHIIAYKEVKINNINDSFAAVYWIKFILFSEDLVCVYSCYYDFITNKTMKEAKTETYFKDIVSLATRQGYREISLDHSDTAIPKALTVEINISSGSNTTIELADTEFFAGIKKLHQTSLNLQGIPSWVKESEKILGMTEKILRQQIRFHKNKEDYRPS